MTEEPFSRGCFAIDDVGPKYHPHAYVFTFCVICKRSFAYKKKASTKKKLRKNVNVERVYEKKTCSNKCSSIYRWVK